MWAAVGDSDSDGSESLRGHTDGGEGDVGETAEARRSRLIVAYEDGLRLLLEGAGGSPAWAKAERLFLDVAAEATGATADGAVGAGGAGGAPHSSSQLAFLALKHAAKCEAARGAHGEALQHLVAAVGHDPTDVVTWRTIGSVALASGNPTLARFAFARALHVNPRHPPSVRGLARSCRMLDAGEQGKHRKAVGRESSDATADVGPVTCAVPRGTWASLCAALLRSLPETVQRLGDDSAGYDTVLALSIRVAFVLEESRPTENAVAVGSPATPTSHEELDSAVGGAGGVAAEHRGTAVTGSTVTITAEKEEAPEKDAAPTPGSRTSGVRAGAAAGDVKAPKGAASRTRSRTKSDRRSDSEAESKEKSGERPKRRRVQRSSRRVRHSSATAHTEKPLILPELLLPFVVPPGLSVGARLGDDPDDSGPEPPPSYVFEGDGDAENDESDDVASQREVSSRADLLQAIGLPVRAGSAADGQLPWAVDTGLDAAASAVQLRQEHVHRAVKEALSSSMAVEGAARECCSEVDGDTGLCGAVPDAAHEYDTVRAWCDEFSGKTAVSVLVSLTDRICDSTRSSWSDELDQSAASGSLRISPRGDEEAAILKKFMAKASYILCSVSSFYANEHRLADTVKIPRLDDALERPWFLVHGGASAFAKSLHLSASWASLFRAEVVASEALSTSLPASEPRSSSAGPGPGEGGKRKRSGCNESEDVLATTVESLRRDTTLSILSETARTLVVAFERSALEASLAWTDRVALEISLRHASVMADLTNATGDYAAAGAWRDFACRIMRAFTNSAKAVSMTLPKTLWHCKSLGTCEKWLSESSRPAGLIDQRRALYASAVSNRNWEGLSPIKDSVVSACLPDIDGSMSATILFRRRLERVWALLQDFFAQRRLHEAKTSASSGSGKHVVFGLGRKDNLNLSSTMRNLGLRGASRSHGRVGSDDHCVCDTFSICSGVLHAVGTAAAASRVAVVGRVASDAILLLDSIPLSGVSTEEMTEADAVGHLTTAIPESVAFATVRQCVSSVTDSDADFDTCRTFMHYVLLHLRAAVSDECFTSSEDGYAAARAIAASAAAAAGAHACRVRDPVAFEYAVDIASQMDSLPLALDICGIGLCGVDITGMRRLADADSGEFPAVDEEASFVLRSGVKDSADDVASRARTAIVKLLDDINAGSSLRCWVKHQPTANWALLESRFAANQCSSPAEIIEARLLQRDCTVRMWLSHPTVSMLRIKIALYNAIISDVSRSCTIPAFVNVCLASSAGRADADTESTSREVRKACWLRNMQLLWLLSGAREVLQRFKLLNSQFLLLSSRWLARVDCEEFLLEKGQALACVARLKTIREEELMFCYRSLYGYSLTVSWDTRGGGEQFKVDPLLTLDAADAPYVFKLMCPLVEAEAVQPRSARLDIVVSICDALRPGLVQPCPLADTESTIGPIEFSVLSLRACEAKITARDPDVPGEQFSPLLQKMLYGCGTPKVSFASSPVDYVQLVRELISDLRAQDEPRQTPEALMVQQLCELLAKNAAPVTLRTRQADKELQYARDELAGWFQQICALQHVLEHDALRPSDWETLGKTFRAACFLHLDDSPRGSECSEASAASLSLRLRDLSEACLAISLVVTTPELSSSDDERTLPLGGRVGAWLSERYASGAGLALPSPAAGDIKVARQSLEALAVLAYVSYQDTDADLAEQREESLCRAVMLIANAIMLTGRHEESTDAGPPADEDVVAQLGSEVYQFVAQSISVDPALVMLLAKALRKLDSSFLSCSLRLSALVAEHTRDAEQHAAKVVLVEACIKAIAAPIGSATFSAPSSDSLDTIESVVLSPIASTDTSLVLKTTESELPVDASFRVMTNASHPGFEADELAAIRVVRLLGECIAVLETAVARSAPGGRGNQSARWDGRCIRALARAKAFGAVCGALAANAVDRVRSEVGEVQVPSDEFAQLLLSGDGSFGNAVAVEVLERLLPVKSTYRRHIVSVFKPVSAVDALTMVQQRSRGFDALRFNIVRDYVLLLTQPDAAPVEALGKLQRLWETVVHHASERTVLRPRMASLLVAAFERLAAPVGQMAVRNAGGSFDGSEARKAAAELLLDVACEVFCVGLEWTDKFSVAPHHKPAQEPIDMFTRSRALLVVAYSCWTRVTMEEGEKQGEDAGGASGGAGSGAGASSAQLTVPGEGAPDFSRLSWSGVNREGVDPVLANKAIHVCEGRRKMPRARSAKLRLKEHLRMGGAPAKATKKKKKD